MKKKKLLIFSLAVLFCAALAGTTAAFAVWTVKKEASNQITIADVVVDFKNADTEEDLRELIINNTINRFADESSLPDYGDYAEVSVQRASGFAAGGRFRLVRNNAVPVTYELSISSQELTESGYADKLYVYLYDVTDYAESGALSTVWSGQAISELPENSGLIGDTDGCRKEIIYELFVFCADNTLGNLTLNFPLTLSSRIASTSNPGELLNGGFEAGMTGWTITGGAIGDVSTASHYWTNEAGGYLFNKDGVRLFSAYATDVESAIGYLTSSQFTISGSGFMTFKLGGAREADKVYVDIIEAGTGKILARYGNSLWQEVTDGVKTGCTLIAYKADLSSFDGKTAYIRITDNATTNYGLFFVDSFVTYYETEPDSGSFNTAVAISAPDTIYEILNGGFETGNLTGWTMSGDNGNIGAVTNASTYFNSVSYNKTDEYFFSGGDYEGNTGSLRSNIFEIGGCGYISFKIGGMKGTRLRLEIVDAVTGTILTSFINGNGVWDYPNDGWTLIGYTADLSGYTGSSVFIRLVDDADNDYGVIIADEIITYYEEAIDLPDGYAAAIPL